MSHPTDDELVDLALGETVDAEVAPTSRAAQSAPRRWSSCAAPRASPPARWRMPRGRLPTTPSGRGVTAPDRRPSDRLASRPTSPTPDGRRDPSALHSDVTPPRRRPLTDGMPTRFSPAGSATRERSGCGRLVAASLVVGLLAGRAIWSPDDERAAGRAGRPVDPRHASSARERPRSCGPADGLDLHVVTDRPLDAGDGYLEVWLLNADGKRMVSVGVLRPGESGTFPISQALIDQGYVIVDISKEQFDDKPAHSGDSLLRGQLPA